MPPTPVLIPVPQPRWSAGPILTDTPPPTIRLAVALPPPPPPVFEPSGTGEPSAAAFDGEAAAAPGPKMPEVGEELPGFRLVEELGRGTFGRVFLAKQAALAWRPVALKVTLRPNREAERLARLQHTNVVPVHSVHTLGPVQLICMPFLGRQTLADALKTHRTGSGSSSGWSKKATRAQRGSTTVITGPARPKSDRMPAAPPAGPVAALVGDAGAVLRLLAQLAAGLAHAHGRGILHLDIKPGNVLIADTGEPMLLDFNLSVDSAEADRELVGGTIPYMAPEQLLDMKSRGKGGVDARTDLYALGVVTYELLTGETPFQGASRSLADYDKLLATRHAGPPPLRLKNPGVTPAFEAIVRKLLAPDPANRYQTAHDLKEDVDRQLADRPLRFARDRSVAERARKWRRRNPRLLVGAVVALVVLSAGGTGAFAVQAADGRSDAEARLKADAVRDKLHSLRLDLTVPDEPVYAARGIARSRELLAAYGLPDDPHWRDREAFRRLPAETRAELAGDFGELLTLLGTARYAAARELPGGEAAPAHDEAVRYVRAAADCFADGPPPPPALVRLARDLGMDAAPPGKAATGRDHFLDAAGHARAGREAEAVVALEEATLHEPGHAAAHHLLGLSLGRLGQPERAAERHAFAAGLMKTESRTYVQWGCAELRGGHPGRALRVFERAANLAGGATPDLRHFLGVTRVRLGRYEEAGADLTTALTAGVRPVSALTARAEAREKAGDRDGAAADRRAALTAPCATGVALLERGRVREATDPAGARADYRGAVEAGGPAVADAYRGLLRLALDRPADPADALRAADEAAGRFPHRADFVAARAVALGRLGKADEARAAVATAAKLGPDADDSFRLAGALARSADASDRLAAVRWLRRAYLAGSRDLARFDGAADLVGIRELAEYRAFRAAAGELGR